MEIKEALPSEQYISDIKDIYKEILNIKQRIWYTNFYISVEELQEWVNENSVSIIKSKFSIIIFREKNRFDMVYFITSDVSDVCALLRQIFLNTSRCFVTDILYKNTCPYDIMEKLQCIGFEKNSTHERMFLDKFNFPVSKDKENLQQAVVSNINEIYDIFYSNFNEYTDQLPTKGEILKAINSEFHDIIIVKNSKKNCIVNIFWFEHKGKTILWRYWVIRPEFRGKGLGRKLLQQVLGKYAHASRIILWVRDNNPQAKAFYEELGFVSDGLYDCTLCKL